MTAISKEEKEIDEEKQRDELIYEVIVDRYHQELQRTSDLDSKANNVTGFSGILITLIATIAAYLLKGHYPLLFLIPLIILIISAIFGLLAYRVKTYSAIEPKEFIKEYYDKPKTKVLQDYTATIAQNTMDNHNVHEEKANLIKWAFIFLVLAISLFLVIAIINWLV